MWRSIRVLSATVVLRSLRTRQQHRDYKRSPCKARGPAAPEDRLRHTVGIWPVAIRAAREYQKTLAVVDVGARQGFQRSLALFWRAQDWVGGKCWSYIPPSGTVTYPVERICLILEVAWLADGTGTAACEKVSRCY